MLVPMGEGPLIYIVAAERSGDLLGAGLIDALRARENENYRFSGIGGNAMAKAGVASDIDIDGLSILGFVEGLKAYGLVKQKVSEAVENILRAKPAVVVLVDSWGFTLRVAQAVRAAAPDIKLVKYVGPQVFATRPGRAKTLAATVDHLLTILSFDAPFYRQHGLPVTFVGNPTLERPLSGNGAQFRLRHNITPDADILIVLPGSRPSEIKRLYEPFSRSIDLLGDTVRPVLVLADPISDMVHLRLAKDPRWKHAVVVPETEKADAFSAADLALACSGTVVTELATAGIPTVTAYKLGWITWAIIRGLRVLKSRFISLVNIAADKALVPEIVQTRCTGKIIARELQALLDNPEDRLALSKQLQETTDRMRGEGEASERAAAAIAGILVQ
ncbi:MAG: lipid-A-disaccharide synthase [Maricaulis sp.]|jgi:lipid-A-disaccharide synthase|nr:lipid-A-disaccharide synthase [Maricaulis sp.]MDG2043079.1 lipid-A-disaccharide synthase [Maricaulis sp.]